MSSPSNTTITYATKGLYGLGPDSDPIEIPQYSEEDEDEIPKHSEVGTSESGNDRHSGFGAPDLDEPDGDDEEEDADYKMEGQGDEHEDMFANEVRLTWR